MRTKLVLWTTISLVAVALCACSSDSDPPGDQPDAGGNTNADATATNADASSDAGGNTNADATTTNADAAADSGVVPPDSGVPEMDSGVPQPNPLGCRNVSVRTGEDGDGADNSVFYTTAFNSPDTDLSEFIDARGWQIGGPLVLCAGAIANGKAAVTLQSDVTFAISLPLDNCLCRTYIAAGSTGSLYCGPSADMLDFTQTIDSMGEGMEGPVMIVGGPNAVTREGEVRVTFQNKATSIQASSADCTPAACVAAVAAENEFATEYTTGGAISEVTNARQGNAISISVGGKPFDDDPMDGTADCDDWMNANVKGALAGAPGFDFDNTDVGQAKDVVTIERIAE